jgi:hypothetical protein
VYSKRKRKIRNLYTDTITLDSEKEPVALGGEAGKGEVEIITKISFSPLSLTHY